jgi:Flp pilus assembly pilin Flp
MHLRISHGLQLPKKARIKERDDDYYGAHSNPRGQRGNALVEYVLLLTLVGLAVVMGVSFFGQAASTEFGIVADEVASLLSVGGSGSGSASGSAGSGQSSRKGNGNGHGSGNGGQNSGNGSGGQDNGTGNGK